VPPVSPFEALLMDKIEITPADLGKLLAEIYADGISSQGAYPTTGDEIAAMLRPFVACPVAQRDTGRAFDRG